MRVVIINPPITNPFAPPLSIISLKSYLEKHGIETLQVDASIEFVHYSLSMYSLDKNIEKSNKYIKSGLLYHLYSELIRNNIITDADKPSSIHNILKILKTCCREDSIKIENESFESQYNTLNNAMILSNAPFYPNIVALNYCSCKKGILVDDESNPFLQYYREALMPKIRYFDPDLIGISLSYNQQVVPALSLISEIRNNIGKPVVVGGSCFSIFCKRFTQGKGTGFISVIENENVMTRSKDMKLMLMLLSPFGIRGEGERSLLQLCQRMERQEDELKTCGLLYMESRSQCVMFNQMPLPLSTEEFPLLSLEGLPIGKKYLSSVPIAPLSSSRGCYWRKCAFCDHYTTIDARFRELPLDNIVSTLKSYSEQHGIVFSTFCDESMTPMMLERLSSEIYRSNIGIRFGTQIRIEKALLNLIEPAAKSGLSFLSFGLESGSPRITALMEKGYTHDVAQALLDVCFRNNVFVEYHIIFGFPTEKPDEAFETISFLKKNETKITCIRANPWRLEPESPVGRNLQLYGVIPDTSDLRSYKLKDGISYEEALSFVDILRADSDFGKKFVISSRNEEYFILKQFSYPKLE